MSKEKVENLAQGARKYFGTVGEVAEDVGDYVKERFDEVADAVDSIVVELKDLARKAVENLNDAVDAIKRAIDYLIKQGAKVAAAFQQAIQEGIAAVKDEIYKLTNKTFDSLIDLFNELVESL